MKLDSSSAAFCGNRVRRCMGAALRWCLAVGVAAALAACTGGVSPSTTSEGSIPYTIGVSVTGLTGTGLVLQNNGGNNLSVAADGSFTFTTALVAGNAYNVSVLSQPTNPVQTCVPGNSIGTVDNSNVTDVTIVCTVKMTTTDTIGGTVAGLSGTGLVLQNNGSDNLTTGASGAFTFPTPVAGGTAYSVTVLSPPIGPNQNCVVAQGQGTAGIADVNNVAVTCTTTTSTAYAIGGTVSGLPSGTMLTLENNGRDNLTVSANGPFTFAMLIPSGSAYNVSVSTSSTQSLSCSISNPNGQVNGAAVTNVAINCTPQSALTVSVAGLAGSGLVLQTDAGDTLSITANGPATFPTPLGAGATYTVSVLTQPTNPIQFCSVANPSGTIGTGPLPTVACVISTVTVSGTVSGLLGTGLILQDNNGDNLPIAANGAFTFPTALNTGSTYSVTVLGSPVNPPQSCTVTNPTGSANANVTNIAVACLTNSYTVGGSVTGLTASGLVLQDNNGDNLTLTTSGAFAFPTALIAGSAYSVTILTQPTGTPAQACTLANSTGTVLTANVINVAVTCTTKTFTVGGTVTGLQGSGLVLQDNGGDNLTVTANGAFVFQTPVNSGHVYAATVATQPSNPTQTCTVAGGAGTVTRANITNVAITCSTNKYTVGGTVAGLTGAGLVVQDNAGDNLVIAASGTFTFPTPLISGAAFVVTVLTQPGNPTQTCVVTAGAGTIAAAKISNVAINCTTNKYTVGGTVTGLSGAGLVLQDNAGDNLPVSASGGFTFPTALNSGAAYVVSVLTQPANPSQTCAVSAGSGTVTSANVASVAISCTTKLFTVGGTVTGLTGAGLALKDNGGDALAVTANGAFTFHTSILSGTAYAVTVGTQPANPTQTCSVAAGSGTATNANVTNVVINCATNKYTVGGSVSGLSGTGLVLQDNARDNITVTAAGTFAFPTPLQSGTVYAVTVLTQPTNPAQTCAVSAGGTGTIAAANVINVAVTCTTKTFTVGGTVSGLAGAGLVLQDNGGDNLAVTASGAFTFHTGVVSGRPYAVTVLTQPGNPTQSCAVVTAANGTVTNANITNVAVTCSTNKYTVGGNVTGLAGAGLVLQDNGGDNLPVTANGTFTFPTLIASNGTYTVSVLTQPTNPSQTCVATVATGTVTTSNINNVVVTCTTNTYTISGNVTGLTGSGLVLQNNGGDNLAVAASGGFTFHTAIRSGVAYSVTVLTSPTNPSQTCTVTAGTGTVTTASITNVAVSCVTNKYTVGGTIMGLAGTGLVLQDNGGDNLAVTTNGAFVFHTAVASNGVYAVSVLTQPGNPTQTCTVATPNSGTVTNANVASIAVTCVTPTYSIGGALSGLVGIGLILQDNLGDNLAVAPTGMSILSFTFATKLATNKPYAVSVFAQPTNPSQTCTVVANGSGVVAGADVSNIAVTCAANSYYVGGSVTGLPTTLTGSPLLISDGYADDTLQITGNGTFRFPTKVPSGKVYTLLIDGQPGNVVYGSETDTVCTVAGTGTGTVGGTDTTTLQINCVNQPIGFAYITNADNNTITSYVLSSTGGIVQFGLPIGTDAVPSATAISFSVNLLYVAAAGSNAILGYSLDQNTGVLTANRAVATANLSAPSSLTFDPYVGNYGGLYATNASSNTVSAYLIDQAGSLNEVSGSPYATGTTPSAGTSVSIPYTVNAVTAVGNYVYFTNEGDNTVTGYSVDPTYGILSPVSGSPFKTGHLIDGCPSICIAFIPVIQAGTGLSPNAMTSYVQYGDTATGYVFAAGKTPDITEFVVDGPSGALNNDYYLTTAGTAGSEKYSLATAFTQSNTEYLYAPESSLDYTAIPGGTNASAVLANYTGLGPVSTFGNYLYLTTTCGIYSFPINIDGTLGPLASSVPFTPCSAHAPSSLLVTSRQNPPIG